MGFAEILQALGLSKEQPEQYDLMSTVKKVPMKKAQAAPSNVLTGKLTGLQAQNNMTPIELQRVTLAAPEKVPIPVERYNELLARKSDALSGQEETINEIKNLIGTMKNTSANENNIAGWLGASDVVSGTNLLKDYQTPEQKAEAHKLKTLDAKGLLAKLQGNLTEDQTKFFQAQLTDTTALQRLAQDQTKAQQTMQLQQERTAAEVAGKNQTDNTKKTDIISDESKAIMNAQTKRAGKRFTPGQEAADRAFGKEDQDWKAQGGYSGVQKQLDQLRSAKAYLLSHPNATGALKGALPDAVRKRIDPEGFQIQQQVRQAVQGSLKQTLGNQFTEREGERVMGTSFDSALPVDENIKKIDATIKDLDTKALEKERASKHFSKHGTISDLAVSNKIFDSGPQPKKPMSFEEWKKAKGHK